MNFKAKANIVMQKYCDSGSLTATADHDCCAVNSSLKVENFVSKVLQEQFTQFFNKEDSSIIA